MGNDSRTGHQITPLVLWVSAGLGGALWAVLFAQGQRTQTKQDAMGEAVATLIAGEQYKKSEMDTLKADVKTVQGEVRSLADRVGKLEPRK